MSGQEQSASTPPAGPGAEQTGDLPSQSPSGHRSGARGGENHHYANWKEFEASTDPYQAAEEVKLRKLVPLLLGARRRQARPGQNANQEGTDARDINLLVNLRDPGKIRPRIFQIRHPWSGTLCQNSQGRCGNHFKKQRQAVKTPLVPNPQPPVPNMADLSSGHVVCAYRHYIIPALSVVTMVTVQLVLMMFLTAQLHDHIELVNITVDALKQNMDNRTAFLEERLHDLNKMLGICKFKASRRGTWASWTDGTSRKGWTGWASWSPRKEWANGISWTDGSPGKDWANGAPWKGWASGSFRKEWTNWAGWANGSPGKEWANGASRKGWAGWANGSPRKGWASGSSRNEWTNWSGWANGSPRKEWASGASRKGWAGWASGSS
ncbi:hypothetical protein Bbelb_130030 [Branchiostoma belcheri]|nr:hypothetical protein Bbelb_130030 [Branchiostoma belcheri]